VQAQPFSQDMFRHDNLLGLGSFTFNFTANGDSQQAIMSSMDGSGGFDLADGALKGINLAAIVRGVNELTQGINPAALQSAVSKARGPAQQTDFSEFLSNFTITDGLVNAPTITLNGPYVTMTGQGTVNLPLQTLDIHIAPKATSTADGQGGRNISVPMVIGGTFSKPAARIDEQALIKLFAGKQIGGLLDNITGRNQPQEEGAEGEEGEQQETSPEQDAAKRFRGLFPGGSQDEEDDTEGDDGTQKASTEETIANEAINAIFGRKKKPAEETTEEKSDGDQ
jgi:AsmA protein